jgi:uncharacterized protein YybS (DUF2232 family)
MKMLYYEEMIDTNTDGSLIGGRFLMIVLILVCGYLLKGFREKRFESLFNIILIGAIIQMFSGYNAVFTRLADYYLQFLILFIPMMFYPADKKAPVNPKEKKPILYFDESSNKVFVIILTLFLIWYYYTTCLSQTIEYKVDDFLDFRFMWDVVENTVGK